MLLSLLLACSAHSSPKSEEISLSCASSAGPLGVSLLLPSEAPGWVAVVEGGAQPWDRYGDRPDHAYSHYRELGVGLQGGGIAVVLYDKRGTGDSPGPLNDLSVRVTDGRAVTACARERLPGARLLRVGHSMGTRVVADLPPGDATVLLSPVIPPADYPPTPLLVLRGGADSPGAGDGTVIPGADHLLMREGRLAPEVVPAVVGFVGGL